MTFRDGLSGNRTTVRLWRQITAPREESNSASESAMEAVQHLLSYHSFIVKGRQSMLLTKRLWRQGTRV
jgi:hypothetical protein